MLAGVGPEARPFGAQNDGDPLGSQCFLQVHSRVPGKADSPKPGIGDVAERSREVHRPDPRHRLQSA